MAIVNFEQVRTMGAGQASRIRPESAALDQTGDPDRPNLYDPQFGYFTFGQSVGCEYDDSDAYQDAATFTIQGVFTRDAEVGDTAADDAGDAAAFAALSARYMALEKLLADKAKQPAPAQYDQWGTADDPRCVKLPAPLRDKDGKPVFALPAGLRIEKTQFPVEIRYAVTLREARPPAAVLLVNGVPLDGAEVTISCPEPVFAHHAIVGTSGEVLQLRYYKAMDVAVSGTLPLIRAGEAVSEEAKRLAGTLEGGKVTLKVATPGGQAAVFEDLDVVEDAGIEADYQNQVMGVTVRARE